MAIDIDTLTFFYIFVYLTATKSFDWKLEKFKNKILDELLNII